MRLRIENFAQIRYADIIMDGITVIAGENNTGKSTVGKILFSLFNATSDIENKIISQRTAEIRNMCRRYLRNGIVYENGEEKRVWNASPFSTATAIARQVDNVLKNENSEMDKVREGVHAVLKKAYGKDQRNPLVQEIENEIMGQIEKIINLPEYAIITELISRYFGNMFRGQINSLIMPELKAKLTLYIKRSKNILLFERNRSKYCFRTNEWDK